MKTVRVLFENGNVITTGISGSKAEILEYFGVGKVFNFGTNDDLLTKVTKCTFITGGK